ncbi:MAG TPA: recombinase family protein, partial [Bacillota bacterium]|nr:recombinase family protein [Bacillota bacterium]
MSDSIHAITPPLITPSLRAAIYARLSDEDKDKTKSGDLSESIQNQITLATRFAREKDWLIVDVYSDDDWSGLDRERPEFNRLLRDCEQGRVDVVLCKDMSRFTRDKILPEEYLETRFAEWQVRFIGLTDGTDTADKSNKKSREINALVNQWYAEDISTKVRAAF